MGKGDTSINYPAQPTYGEGMREALEAQVALLTGTRVGGADFSQFDGGLQKLVKDYEAPLRQSTAQIDTDVLRQTLLGDVTPEQETEVTYDDSGRIIRGYKEGPSYQVRQKIVGRVSQIRDGKNVYSENLQDLTNYNQDRYEEANPGNEGFKPTDAAVQIELISPDGEVVAYSQEDFTPSVDYWTTSTSSRATELKDGEGAEAYTNAVNGLMEAIPESVPESVVSTLQTNIDNVGRLGRDSPLEQVKVSTGEGAPIYATDSEGKIIQDESKAGTTETRVLPAQRAEDGMIDRLGDKQLTADGRKPGFDAQGNFLGLSALAEDVQAGNLSRQRERDLSDVERLSERFQDVMEDFRPGTAEAVTGARDVLESQRQNLTGQRPATAADVAAGDATEVGEMISTGRGLITVPSGGTFGGTATPATLTAATLGVAPTLDAETSFTAAELGTTPTLEAATTYDALDPLARQTLTADTSYTPSAGVTGGSFTAAQAADPMALTAATSFTPSAGVTGEGFTATAGLEGGAIAADPLRQALMADAEAALGQGLTAREERQIAEAARARATMMGRTFDQSEAIREAEARVLEDNARRMQNRAFAQGVLGQEAGLQESDLSRGLQAAAQNQAALNRAAEFTAGQGMQAQLANQAATNEALRLGMAAGLSQEALAAQQKQAQEFANQQAQNRALEFEQNQAMQAQLANQQATNRALEFAAQAGISQEEAQARLGQQAELTEFGAEQQRRESGIQAGLAQDQAQAGITQRGQLAQADFTQQARQAGLQAGMQQDIAQAGIQQDRDILQAQLNQQKAAFDAEAAQQSALADQRQRQQASQFGVGATMDAERLNAQLAQQGALGYVDAATRLAALEDQTTLDPFAALLNRAGGGSLGQAGQVFGQANYGLSSGPQYLNPESGLGFISQMAANEASMYGAQQMANASRSSGLLGGLGSLFGGAAGGLLGNPKLF